MLLDDGGPDRWRGHWLLWLGWLVVGAIVGARGRLASGLASGAGGGHDEGHTVLRRS